jgi:hypothetical protein
MKKIQEPKTFTLNTSNLYKMIRGKKYKYQGSVPKEMEYDMRRIFGKHKFDLYIEKDWMDNTIKLWSRRK